MIVTLQTLIFFRESFWKALNRLLRPYYKKFSLAFGAKDDISEDEESDEQVFAEFDDEKGVIFYPPVYLQRYAAVSDCLMDERWSGKLEKVVDLGYHDMSFIKYLKEVQGIKCILGVDIESIPLRCSSDLIGSDDYIPKRENPLEVTLFQGNAADPDYRLIGCDAMIAIEMIEHMLPQDLERLIHTVFGFVKPQIAIFTTPNGDFNVLFKALERNGLRRLDHFFEWSQEQFHDWCSNIVARYPQYTVSCKGIGPGPAGTEHLGCCSQMALFVAKAYSKQQDLNLNSLALVADTPSPNSISNLISSWETMETPNESHMIEPPKAIESYSELTNSSQKQSTVTIVLTSPSFSLDTILYQDKTSQCNLDTESEKSYLMFDYEKMYYDVVIPRRKVNGRVYVIEDVYSRLNCTTLQVKKFSKTTQNLMAKNKSDTLVHTREVVDEIRHLTKMLNFSKQNNQLENGTWCNINWGDNAPYWNQYYKIVKEYHYPFETKSEESRILDLISDEINRLIDGHFEEEFSYEFNKVEIPIEHLMNVVKHITDDVDKVKDLLEWNGYEVSGDVVIHSRALIEYSSIGTHETDSQDTDMYSDWDSTDIRSTSMSDGSTIVPDYYARCLRRALDQKVRKLRTMLTADEDITTELDRVVCRLMKLALRTSKGRNTPPPTRWMQCKLLDLLTLTEKAIERRKKNYIENYPLTAIKYEEKSEEMMALEKIKEDDTAVKLVDKYQHLVNQTDERPTYRFVDLELDDDLSVSSTEFGKDYEVTERHSPSLVAPEATPNTTLFHPTLASQEELKLERTLAWVEEDIEVVSYPDHGNNVDSSPELTNDYSTRVTKYYKKKFKPLRPKKSNDFNCVICKKSHSKLFKQNKTDDRRMQSVSKTNLVKKVSRKKSSNSLRRHSSNKFVSVDNKPYRIKSRRKHYQSLYPTASKPIPVNLIELCHPETTIGNDMGSYNNLTTYITVGDEKNMVSNLQKNEVAATKQSQLIDIVAEDGDETISFRRTIGTDADVDSMAIEDETLIRSVSNTLMYDDNTFDKHHVSTENVHSQTIFLYDINEPTTSKGIRHIGMDVQCGPDDIVPNYSMLSATPSLTKNPKLYTAGIKIEDSTSDIKVKNADCSTSTNDTDNIYKTLAPRERSFGIKIKDSDSKVFKQEMEYPMLTYQRQSATNSLISMPKMLTLANNNNESQTDIITTGVDCGTCIDNVDDRHEIVVPTDKYNCINIKYCNTYIINENECSTNTQEWFDTSSTSPQSLSKQNILLQSTPKKKCSGFQIDNLGLNYPEKIECSTNTQESCDRSNTSSPRTTLLKSPCKLKMQDSLSEFSVGVDSCAKIYPHFDSLRNGDVQILSAINYKALRILSPTYAKPKLCNGGVQVHSYRDKQMSEDIMYQGEWQKNIPKLLTRRKMFNPIITKKKIDSNLKKKVNSKEKIKNKNTIKTDTKTVPKGIVVQSKKLAITKQESIKKHIEQNEILPVTVGVARIKNQKKAPKVPSKTTINAVSSIHSKSAIVKKPPIIPNFTVTRKSSSPEKKFPITHNISVTKNDKIPVKSIKNNYVPSYLRKKALKSTNNVENDLNLSFLSTVSNKESKVNNTKTLISAKTEKIKRDILKFQTEATKQKFLVFRNEIEKKNSEVDGQQFINTLDNAKKKDSSRHRAVTPTSPTSSTCSSPCSIATVRAVTVRTKNTANRRHSTSSYANKTGNSGSENTSPDRGRKFTKRCKSIKNTEKVSDNKENIPETSKQFNVSKKESDIDKGTFSVQKKDVYLAHVKGTPVQSTGNTPSMHDIKKSNTSISKVVSPSPSKKAFLEFENASPVINNNEMSETSQTSNLVLVIEPQARKLQSFTDISNVDNINVVNNRLVSNWIDQSIKRPGDWHSTQIMSAMRELIDETLDFIDDPNQSTCTIDSETVVLSRENFNQRIDLSLSSTSFKTVIATDDNYKESLQNDIEFALNRSFDTTLGNESILSLADTRLTVVDFDAYSFKSTTSSPKFSEYLADNEFSSSYKDITNSTSVREIYERRDQPFQLAQIQNTSRALAIQAFSGFSINGDPVPGDQPDPVNYIDSETGSLAVNVSRQANSEELLISGRSSDSFDSCILDDDSVVPNWLFQIISQQQSAMDDLEAADELMGPLSVAEPLYDDNGNVLEGPRAGAGAGDGCGIHSDLSQDSSGRGTSVSSSESSSGQQSQTVLIDPVAFAAQFELLRDAVQSSVVTMAVDQLEALDSAMTSRQGPVESDSQSLGRGEARRGPRVIPPASDVDADVSSTDTDVPDSSDN